MAQVVDHHRVLPRRLVANVHELQHVRDVAAARAVGARFFPIVPGAEDASWSLFEKEALGRFFDGGYTAAYEAGLLVAFQEALPSRPPWER